MESIMSRGVGLCSIVAVVVVLCFQVSGAHAESPSQARDVVEASAVDASSESAPADPLLLDVEEAIEITSRRFLQSNVHTPWQIMHGLLALRNNFMIKHADGTKVPALEWISSGATFAGQSWFEKTQFGGRAHPYSSAYAFEGHPNQFLAIFTMSNLPLDHQFAAANSQTVTIKDMIEHAQMEVNTRQEVTWTLWALSHYLEPDAVWQNKWRQNWSMESLIDIQTREEVHNAACGGTHGMFALSYARNSYLQSGRQLTGLWLEAEQKILRYVEVARTYQNSDGTFSSNYFRGGGHSHDLETRLRTSGHTLEFLMVAVPDSRLNEPWLRQGISAVARDLIDHRKRPVECGALYHALSGLVIYRNRVRPGSEVSPNTELAATAPDDATGEEAAPDPSTEEAAGPEAATETDGEAAAEPVEVAPPQQPAVAGESDKPAEDTDPFNE